MGSIAPLFYSLLIVMAKNINSAMIYTRPGCPYCTKIKDVFQQKGWSYTEQALNVNFTREQFKREFGQNATFPQVIIDGVRRGGCTESVKYLRENNYL